MVNKTLLIDSLLAGFLLPFLIGCGLSQEWVIQGNPTVQRHTIKELRDRNVIKQEKDYSCGSAALATLMIYYFGDNTTEAEILDRLNSFTNEEERKRKTLVGFSLLDLKRVAQSMGYRAAGFKLSPEQLVRLTAPVLVHVEPRGYKHFAVLRGVSGGRVYLADPARGNLRMSFDQFLDEWSGVIFVLGKHGEERLKSYPLDIRHNAEYERPEIVRLNGQLELGGFFNLLPLR